MSAQATGQELWRLDAVLLARPIAAMNLSCHEATARAPGHIGEDNPRINALVNVMDDEAPDVFRRARS